MEQYDISTITFGAKPPIWNWHTYAHSSQLVVVWVFVFGPRAQIHINIRINSVQTAKYILESTRFRNPLSQNVIKSICSSITYQQMTNKMFERAFPNGHRSFVRSLAFGPFAFALAQPVRQPVCFASFPPFRVSPSSVACTNVYQKFFGPSFYV